MYAYDIPFWWQTVANYQARLPALERCSVILSRLSGIAKFQTSSDSAGFSVHQIDLISDTVACLHLVSAKILVQVVDELELFAAFSAWLRYVNDIDLDIEIKSQNSTDVGILGMRLTDFLLMHQEPRLKTPLIKRPPLTMERFCCTFKRV